MPRQPLEPVPTDLEARLRRIHELAGEAILDLEMPTRLRRTRVPKRTALRNRLTQIRRYAFTERPESAQYR